jgi:hypothetical protein
MFLSSAYLGVRSPMSDQTLVDLTDKDFSLECNLASDG